MGRNQPEGLDIFFNTDMNSACILLTIKHYNEKMEKNPSVRDVCDFVSEVMDSDTANCIIGNLEANGYIFSDKIERDGVSYRSFGITEKGNSMFESTTS